MTDNPITPPPELVREWNEAAMGTHFPPYGYSEYIATQAARWGADTELEACCEWLGTATYGDSLGIYTTKDVAVDLRAARRSQPLPLKELALQALNRFMATDGHDGCTAEDVEEDYYIIRQAVESLPS